MLWLGLFMWSVEFNVSEDALSNAGIIYMSLVLYIK